LCCIIVLHCAVYTPLLSTIRATCPAHLILLDFITRTISSEKYRSLSSSMCNFLHSSVTSSLLGPNILLYTIFSKTLSLRPPLNVGDQVSHPYKTTGKIILYRKKQLKLQISVYAGLHLHVLHYVRVYCSSYSQRADSHRMKG